ASAARLGDPRGRGRAMVTVGDIEAAEPVDGLLDSLDRGSVRDTPDRVADVLRTVDVEQRRAGRGVGEKRPQHLVASIRAEHRTGLGVQRVDVADTVRLLVGPSELVLAYAILFVGLDGGDAGEAGLNVIRDAHPIRVERRRVL